MKSLFNAIEVNALLARRRVAIGLFHTTPELIGNLVTAAKCADIVIVGTHIEGFECISAKGDRNASDTLLSLVQRKEVDAIARGQIYYTDYHESMNAFFGFTRDVMCPYLLRDFCGNEWFITPMVHHDDCSIDGRCYLASQTAAICERLGNDATISVLAPDKDRGYSKIVDQGGDDANAIVKRLVTDGFNAKLVELRIDLAAATSNIVVPMDGIVGNFVYRSLGSLGGATLVGGFTLTNRFVSIDTSQSQKSFSHAIESAVAIVNLGGMPVEDFMLA